MESNVTHTDFETQYLDLTELDKTIIRHILYYASMAQNACIKSYKTIANELKCSWQKVKETVNKIRRFGVSIQHRGRAAPLIQLSEELKEALRNKLVHRRKVIPNREVSSSSQNSSQTPSTPINKKRKITYVKSVDNSKPENRYLDDKKLSSDDYTDRSSEIIRACKAYNLPAHLFETAIYEFEASTGKIELRAPWVVRMIKNLKEGCWDTIKSKYRLSEKYRAFKKKPKPKHEPFVCEPPPPLTPLTPEAKACLEKILKNAPNVRARVASMLD